MNETRIYPLSYSIPKKCIKPLDLSCKKRLFSKMIPGKKDTYIYKNEVDYNKNYEESYFAFTYKKCGYDCLRHYEILSNNCIPYFLEINNIPDKTMTTFPKNKVSAIISEFDIENPDYKKLDKHIETLHNYTLKYLTCESSALYVINILNNIDNMESLNILMITANRMNYSMMSLAYGLRINLGNRFIDYPKINCLYNKQQFNLHINDDVMIDRTNIIEKIKRKEFDFIICGPCGIDETQIEHTSLVEKYYNKNEIAYVFGGDRPFNTNVKDETNLFRRQLNDYSKKGICFVRELDDNTDYHHYGSWREYVEITRNRTKNKIKEIEYLVKEIKSKKVISFSLWGNIAMYCIGAIKNALLAKYFFPDWICRFYHDSSVPPCIIEYLKKLDNTELVFMSENNGPCNRYRQNTFGSLWRFLVCIDDSIEQYLVCDADSRVNLYMKYYFETMLSNNHTFIRFVDLPSNYPICAGAFGGCKNAVKFEQSDFELYNNGRFYCDQEFLKKIVYPQIEHKCFTVPRIHHNRPDLFNVKLTGHFVGKVLNENDESVNKYTNSDYIKCTNYDNMIISMNKYNDALNITLKTIVS